MMFPFATDAVVRLFLRLDFVVHSVLGLFLFFRPHSFAQIFLSRPSDGIHWHLLRCVGGQLLASASLSWRCSSPHRPAEVRSACLLLRLLSNILCLFLFLHSQSVHSDHIHPLKILRLFLVRQLIWFCTVLIALSLGLLLLSGWPIGDRLYRENKWGNILYQIDTIAAICIGVAWVLAPHWLLHRQVRVPMDSSHALCGQMMGVLFIASQVISAHALHWHQQADRAMAAETRAILCLFILSAQFWSQIAYGKHWSDKHWVGISLFSTWTVIAILYRTYLYIAGGDLRVEEGERKEGLLVGRLPNGTHIQKKIT